MANITIIKKRRVRPRCLTDACKSKRYHGSGFCRPCEHRNNGTELPECLTDGCIFKKRRSSGLCDSCEHKRNGTEPPECLTDGCKSKKHHGSGLCIICERKRNGTQPPDCLTDDCKAKKYYSTGFCELCEHKRNGTQRPPQTCPCNGPICPNTGRHTNCPYGIQYTKKHYDKQCVRCFCATYPNDQRAIMAKIFLHAKEQCVREVLQTAFPEHRWTFDRGFAVGVRQRPDVQLKLPLDNANHRILIVEVDEDSHRTYDCAMERRREEIFQAHTYSTTDIVMIRFNPDAYTDYNGFSHPSCFKYNRISGTVRVDSEQRTQWQVRCEDLISVVDFFMDSSNEIPPPESGRVFFSCEMFYDNIREQDSETLDMARRRRLRKRGIHGVSHAVSHGVAHTVSHGVDS